MVVHRRCVDELSGLLIGWLGDGPCLFLYLMSQVDDRDKPVATIVDASRNRAKKHGDAVAFESFLFS